MTHPQKTWLYRAVDASGELLYVGITSDPVKRMDAHIKDASPWVPFANDVELYEFPSREAAAAAERTAISDEAPTYNIQGNSEFNQRFAPYRRAYLPSDLVSELEGCARLRAELPAMTTALVLDARGHGASYAQISELLGMSTQGIKMMLRRAGAEDWDGPEGLAERLASQRARQLARVEEVRSAALERKTSREWPGGVGRPRGECADAALVALLRARGPMTRSEIWEATRGLPSNERFGAPGAFESALTRAVEEGRIVRVRAAYATPIGRTRVP